MVYREQEMDLAVTRREVVTSDVVALTLADPAGGTLPGWTPGGHIDLVLDETFTRQYSLCGPLRDRTSFRIAVLRAADGGGGSRLVHDSLKEGSQVRVRGPRNHFALIDAPRYVFIAGGIGITPLLPMIEFADRRGASWTLHYGGRQRASMAFLDELTRYGDRVRTWPQDEFGLLDLPGILGEPRPDTLVYCCGPEALLAAVEAQCAAWLPGALHTERFTPKPVRTRGRRRHLVRAGAAAFGDHRRRTGGQDGSRGGRGGGAERAVLLPCGHLRHLRAGGCLRRDRSSGLGADRAGPRGRGVHDDLRVPLPL